MISRTLLRTGSTSSACQNTAHSFAARATCPLRTWLRSPLRTWRMLASTSWATRRGYFSPSNELKISKPVDVEFSSQHRWSKWHHRQTSIRTTNTDYRYNNSSSFNSNNITNFIPNSNSINRSSTCININNSSYNNKFTT